MRSFFNDIEVMQQPAAFCDGVIIAWIAQLRKDEGYDKVISVRDMFAGGLSATCKRMSIVCEQLLSFIAGKNDAGHAAHRCGCGLLAEEDH